MASNQQNEEEQKEISFRKTVLTTIETLIDIEHVSEALEHLKHLHGLAWDEVIEERFVNKQCGFPACERSPPRKKKPQMYHIDKKEKKIYESCSQRGKFCSERCYRKSFFVRNQLDEQPLWITGFSEQRMKKTYEMPDETFVVENEEKDDEEFEKDDKIEFVADSLIAKVKEMKLNEEFEEPKPIDEDEKESYKLTEDDKDFIRSIRQFKSNNFGASPSKKSSDNPATKVKLSVKELKKEEEILGKLREKYGNKNQKQKKPPILIEAPKLGGAKNEKLRVHNSWLLNLIRSWLTPETRHLVQEGARPSGGDVEQMLMAFFHGKKGEQSSVNLPNLDKYNVKEKRLNIFLHSIRQHWLELEARLHLTPTRRDLLSRVAATFRLDSENITGWNKQEINSIVFALFLVVCLIDVELGDDYFLQGRVSPELSEVSSDLCGLDAEQVLELHMTIKTEFAC